MSKFRKDSILLFLWLIGILFVGLYAKLSFAGDTHYSDESHRVTYSIVDSSGDPVAGQTVTLAVGRSTDNKFLDFNDNTFKSSGWTSRTVSMSYDTVGEYYYRVITIDQAVTITSDYCATISNDNATYADHQTECWGVSNLNDLIKTHR